MADASRPRELRATPDPYGHPPRPDGDRVHREPPPNTDPPTTRQRLIALLVVVIVVAAVVIGAFR